MKAISYRWGSCEWQERSAGAEYVGKSCSVIRMRVHVALVAHRRAVSPASTRLEAAAGGKKLRM